jgi:hypothetical protein
MTLAVVHGRLANTALLFMLFMGLWGLWRYFHKEGLNANFWGALVIGEILILIQGLLGAYLYLTGLRPERSLHILYGIASALTIPGVYAFTKGADDRRTMLIYSVALLFLVGLIIRGITTA